MNIGPTGYRANQQAPRKGTPPRASWAWWVTNSINTNGRKIASRPQPLFASSGTSGYVPWKPSFRTVDDQPQVKFNLGLLDQLAADNWNTWLDIDADATKWPTLNVTASDGRIGGFTISLEDNTPTESQIQENTPPGSFKIVLGVIMELTALMVVNENLEAFAMEVFRASKDTPAEGEEAFNRWWKWSIVQITGGSYPYVT